MKLFSPWALGPIELSNRIAMSPMTGFVANINPTTAANTSDNVTREHFILSFPPVGASVEEALVPGKFAAKKVLQQGIP